MWKKLRPAAYAAFGRIGRATTVLVLALTGVLFAPAEALAAPCQSSGPPSAAYTVNVCFASPSDGATANGQTAVSATVSVTGTSPGVRRMTFYLGGEHLLTDFESPYTFTIPSDRYVDGLKTLEVEAWMRDGFISQRASINLTFANGVTTPPVNTNTFTPTSGTTPSAGQPFVLAAAGDGAGGEQTETDTTNLIASWNPNLFLYLGDVYEKGTVTEFFNWYRPSDSFYGRFRQITNPTIGNHEYENGQAQGYFDYWDNVPNYYSFNANGWHFISLNSNSSITPTSQGSAQYQWLAADLDQNSHPCTVAYFHHPLYNIGEEGSALGMADMWSLFTQKGVDLVLTAHDHTYQRWQPLDGSGSPDANGVTQIVVGTGGHAIGSFVSSDPRVVASATEFGAFRFQLNSSGASYQFITAQGQTLDSGSVGCNGAASDTTPPSTPTGLTADGVYKTRIDLSWTASSDNVGVTGYELYRDGQPLTTIGPQTTYADTSVLPGSTHTYKLRALDAANNTSGFSDTATATTPTTSVLFHDGFESGDLSGWTQNNGLAVQQAQVFAGSYAAQAINSGSAGASAYKQLESSETDLYYVARFKVVGHAQNVNLLRFRNSTVGASAMVTLFVTTTNKLGFRNDVTAVSTTSTTTATVGVWHTAQVHLVVNGLSSQIEVWLDGIRVADLSQNDVNLGTNPIGRLELGDPSLNKTFDVALDEIAYDREFITDATAPAAPTNLVATAHSGLEVDLSWTAGTDDVAVNGYDVYRDGNVIASIGAETGYADKTVSPHTSYSYRLVAKDAAGNVSPPSNTASVTTGDIFTENFESGNLVNWTGTNGLTVQQQVVDTGSWAARATSAGAAGASASKQLDATVNELYYRARFKLLSQGANSVSLLRFRTAANGALASAFVSSTGKLAYRNDTNGSVITSAQTVAPAIWHEIQMRLLAGGAASHVDVWLDGIRVITQADSLSSGAIGRLELGDPSTGRSFDVAFDSVVADLAFIVDTAAPTAPQNAHATSVTASEVDLAWDPATDDVGVTTYRVRRDGAPVSDVDGSTLTYADTGLNDGTQYTYTLTALDAVGHESPASDAVQVTTLDVTKPDMPTNLTATPVAGANRINLSWTAATDNLGVTGYRIYRSDMLPDPIASIGASPTSYGDTTVAPVTTYTYSVSALDAAGNESNSSQPATATSSDTVAPQPPSGLVATTLSDVQVNLSWTAASDNVAVTGYEIYRNGSPSPAATVDSSTTTFSDTAQTADTTYTYTVKAVDAAGNHSLNSNTATATTYLLVDGFETGNLSRWTGSTNFSVQNLEVFAGSWAGQAMSNGKKATISYAYKQLSATRTDLHYQLRFKLLSAKKDTVDLLRFGTAAGGSLVSLLYDSNRKLGYRVGAGQRVSSTILSANIWYEANVHVVVNGTASRVEVWLNGTAIPLLTRTESLGTTPIGRLEVGESLTGHGYDVAFDEVLIKRTP